MVFRGRVTETFRTQSQFYNSLVWGIRVQAGLGDVGWESKDLLRSKPHIWTVTMFLLIEFRKAG